MTEALTLFELNKRVRILVEEGLSRRYWVRGELAEGREAQNGHFYGELIDRDPHTQTIRARARINCWRGTYAIVSKTFLHDTGKPLSAGLKILVQVSVGFHEQYGYSLTIQDIDPSYTLGNAAIRRKEIIEQLRRDGLLEANRELPLPLLPLRIAVVSSETAAGYGDFLGGLRVKAKDSHSPFPFVTRLFPALMQGQGVTESIFNALEQIASEAGEWDAVVIIRGGGAVTDLSDFDSYPLAATIAQFPLPVFTGIGHERDSTVIDAVAYMSLRTPTAVAAFFVETAQKQADDLTTLETRIHQAAEKLLLMSQRQLEDLGRRCTLATQGRLSSARRRVESLIASLPLACMTLCARERNRLERSYTHLASSTTLRLQAASHTLSLLTSRLDGLDPSRQLAKGYSLTLTGGHLLRSLDDLKEGQELITILSTGQLTSHIKTWKRNPPTPETP